MKPIISTFICQVYPLIYEQVVNVIFSFVFYVFRPFSNNVNSLTILTIFYKKEILNNKDKNNVKKFFVPEKEQNQN